MLLQGRRLGENHGAVEADEPIRFVIFFSPVFLHLMNLDAERLSVVLPVGDQKLDTRRDGFADPAVLWLVTVIVEYTPPSGS